MLARVGTGLRTGPDNHVSAIEAGGDREASGIRLFMEVPFLILGLFLRLVMTASPVGMCRGQCGEQISEGGGRMWGVATRLRHPPISVSPPKDDCHKDKTLN